MHSALSKFCKDKDKDNDGDKDKDNDGDKDKDTLDQFNPALSKKTRS